MQHSTRIATILASMFLALAACQREETLPKKLPPLPSENVTASTGVGAPPKSVKAASRPEDSAKPPVGANLDPKRVESPMGISFDIVDGWSRQAPKSNMRVAELVPPRATGETLDGLLIVSFFGGGAGSFDDNIERWASQVSDDKGAPRASGDGRIREIPLGSGGKAKIYEIDGNHTDTNMRTGESTKTPNARLITATIDTETGSYFFKLIGPVKSIAAATPGYEAMLRSVKLK